MSESPGSDRNSSYDNVDKRHERGDDRLDVKPDRISDLSECDTILLDTDESDVERMKRNRSFKERLDPLLCKCFVGRIRY